jgi:hypothetical protein
MESEGINNKFESLPIEAQKQVLAFIDFLQKRYESKTKMQSVLKPLSNKKFVGIWKNREDLKDISLWIRNVRKKQWREIG